MTDLGLNFALVTQWTAFVAVSEKIYNPNPGQTPTLPVPVAQVKGVSELAYGEPAAPITGGGSLTFAGSSGPEPASLLAFALVALLFGGFLLRTSQQRLWFSQKFSASA
ncbi:MAG: PEP-CTERM sorting domain-containing protein [Candidatus Competibacteraceae bacterium]